MKSVKAFLLVVFCLRLGFLKGQSQFFSVDSLMLSAIERGMIQGGAVAAVRADSILYVQVYGHRRAAQDTLPVTHTTLFDLASLTKPIATGMAVMNLMQEGQLSLADTIAGTDIAHLLTHTTGIPAYLSPMGLNGRPQLTDSIYTLIRHATERQERYSCLNYIALQDIIEHLTSEDLDTYTHKHIFEPLGMTHTCFLPIEKGYTDIATTFYQGDTLLLDGIVQDPLAQLMGGISGNAGLFSTIDDMAWFAQFLLREKDSPMMRLAFSTPEELPTQRSLLWDYKSEGVSCAGTLTSPSAHCHTGYTGTSIVIDTEQDIAIVILTCRRQPRARGMQQLRSDIADSIIKHLNF